MAVTQGHGNPHWTREEVILALELYFDEDASRLPREHPKIVELSDLLLRLPYHQASARNATFRNPAGVAFKIQNLRQVATGKGLSNTSRMDRRVWAEFQNQPNEVRRLAALIRAGLHQHQADNDDAAELEFYEGRLLTRQHVIRERNPNLRRELLKRRENALFCDVCESRFEHIPASARAAAFEAHHIIPIAEAGEKRTRVSDLALLCACCHRWIHREISDRRAWVPVPELAQQVRKLKVN